MGSSSCWEGRTRTINWRLEKSEFKRLVKEGKITIEKIEGLPVPQVRFQPEHFDEFNELIKWGEIIEL